MTQYNSYYELKTNILEMNDLVIFKIKNKTLKYTVRNSYLKGPDFNDEIFIVLGIKNKRAFCSSAYSYEDSDGVFPQCRNGDYPALTRVALELFKRCDRYNIILLE